MPRSIIFINRAKNLEKLLHDMFKGDTKAFSNFLEINENTFLKYCKPLSDRPCNDRAAKRIEKKLNLPMYSLDALNQEGKDIYYVAVYTNAKFTYEIVKALQIYESITECASVLGDIDILLKIEINSSQILDMLLINIGKLPGVKRINTYTSAPNLRWQRGQFEDMELPNKDESLYCKKGVDKFISRKMANYFDAIGELEKGEITILDNDVLSPKSYELIEGTIKSIYATRNPYENISGLKKYLSCEKALISRGIEVNRIIFLPSDYKKNWSMIEENYQLFISTGCNIKFLLEKQWTHSPLSSNSEQFLIIDNEFVCVRRDEQERLLVKRTPEIVHMYHETFAANWHKAVSFDNLGKINNSRYQI